MSRNPRLEVLNALPLVGLAGSMTFLALAVTPEAAEPVSPTADARGTLDFGCLLCLAAFYGTPRADRARRSRSPFRHGGAQAGSRSGERIVRSPGAAFARRQPVHRAGDGQGHRDFAGSGGRGLRGATPHDRSRGYRHVAPRIAPEISPDRGRSAAWRGSDAARRARRGE